MSFTLNFRVLCLSILLYHIIVCLNLALQVLLLLAAHRWHVFFWYIYLPKWSLLVSCSNHFDSWNPRYIFVCTICVHSFNIFNFFFLVYSLPWSAFTAWLTVFCAYLFPLSWLVIFVENVFKFIAGYSLLLLVLFYFYKCVCIFFKFSVFVLEF